MLEKRGASKKLRRLYLRIVFRATCEEIASILIDGSPISCDDIDFDPEQHFLGFRVKTDQVTTLLAFARLDVLSIVMQLTGNKMLI
mmetsp:Transcript_39018/g.63231  ORF Transcript_39018/g.63231 Transcript_39018/m.63231 type:complete len:86 (-) Transcript_39018:453-710(-)